MFRAVVRKKEIQKQKNLFLKIKFMKKILLSIITITIFIAACQQAELKENLQKKSQKTTLSNTHYQIKNGTIFFSNQTDLIQLNVQLSNMLEEERLKWEKENNFVSLKTIQHKALDEIQNETDEQKFKQWYEKYSDLFEIVEDENGEKYVELKNKDFNCILNNQKEVFSNNKKFDVNNNIKLKTEIRTELVEIAQTNNPKRRVKLSMNLYQYRIQNSYHLNTSVEVRGYRQIAAWVPYKTLLYYKEVNGEVYLPQKQNTTTYYFGWNQTNSEEYSLSRDESIFVSNKPSDNYSYGFYFVKAYGRGQSRGCGELEAKIDYKNN